MPRGLSNQPTVKPARQRKDQPARKFALIVEGFTTDLHESADKLNAAIQVSFPNSGTAISVTPAVRTLRKRNPGDARRSPVTNKANSEKPRDGGPDLHDPTSGRLSAKKVNATFGVPLTAVAKVAGRSLATISRTPDSPALQPALRVLYRIAAALFLLVGTEQGLRIWINQPNTQLNGMTPWDVILAGDGEVVALLLENMVIGQPA